VNPFADEDTINLELLQSRVKDKDDLQSLDRYFNICYSFLKYIQSEKPTRIISPTEHNYIFFQYSNDFNHNITRPINSAIFIENSREFKTEFKMFIEFLEILKEKEDKAIGIPKFNKFIETRIINRVLYTIQQSIGCIGDSFENTNQARKRIGQIFEQLIKLVIKKLDINCESRTLNISLPAAPDFSMKYELDMVISKGKAIITNEDTQIHPKEIVGSIKTTSKDRIDKIFLDKYMLSKLLGKEIPVIAIFLHDVQRAKKKEMILALIVHSRQITF
jgi:hypothetical protein